MHIADVAHHSEATIASMSPNALLAEAEAIRVEVSVRRDAMVDKAQANIERLQMELQDAERDLAWKREGQRQAFAIAYPATDRVHDRRVGDVLVRLDNGKEHVVMGIEVNDYGVVRYLTIPYAHRNDAVGDGPAPDWHFAGEFRKP